MTEKHKVEHNYVGKVIHPHSGPYLHLLQCLTLHGYRWSGPMRTKAEPFGLHSHHHDETWGLQNYAVGLLVFNKFIKVLNIDGVRCRTTLEKNKR